MKNIKTFQPVIFTFLIGSFCVLISMNGLSLMLAPLVFLFLLFFFNYNYIFGLRCWIISFSFQNAVIFMPEFGLSAYLRLNQVMFIPIVIVWLFRVFDQKSSINKKTPLIMPLILYLVAAILSLLWRMDSFSSTHFWNTATGWKGFTPCVLLLLEVLAVYLIMTDEKFDRNIYQTLMTSLKTMVILTIILATLYVLRFIPQDFISQIYYDPTAWYTRTAFMGNTSSWGVLLIYYFFILMYMFYGVRNFWSMVLTLAAMAACVMLVLVSGCKTAMVCIGLGVPVILWTHGFSKYAHSVFLIFISVVILVLIYSGSISIFTESQKLDIDSQFGQLSILYDQNVDGIDRTSLKQRIQLCGEFTDALQEEPSLLLTGRGWQRRVEYHVPYHNDILTALHDLGFLGVIFILLMYYRLVAQYYWLKKTKLLDEDLNLLCSVLMIIFVMAFLSSFATENLTLYPLIEIVFPVTLLISGISWSYCNCSIQELQTASTSKQEKKLNAVV